jgi:hypothetical protein
MVLFASIFAFVAWVFKSGLPRPGTDPGYVSAFSGTRFAILGILSGPL